MIFSSFFNGTVTLLASEVNGLVMQGMISKEILLHSAIKPITPSFSIIYYTFKIPIKAFHSNDGVRGYFHVKEEFI